MNRNKGSKPNVHHFLTVLTGFNILTVLIVKGTHADTVEVKEKKIQEI
jgi:hypothetical protein